MRVDKRGQRHATPSGLTLRTPKNRREVGWLSEQNLPGFCPRSVVIRANFDLADAHVGWVVQTFLVPEPPQPPSHGMNRYIIRKSLYFGRTG